MALIDKLLKNSTVKETKKLNESFLFTEKDFVSTKFPIINIAFGGSLHGGFLGGIHQFAGPSKHFKSCLCLICAKAYLDKYPDAIMVLYDCEGGMPEKYFDTFDIDANRVIHTPITDIEVLKQDIVKQLDMLTEGDHVVFVFDSLGNVASKKELDDTRDGKSVADMSRAKSIKGLFRMITPMLVFKNIPMFVVNHTYKEMSLFPKDIVGGGTGSVYSANNIFIIGRQQEKDGKDVTGYNFILRAEKSRGIKENSKLGLNITFENGINKYSGLLALAVEGGFVDNSSKGWYSIIDQETGEVIGKKLRENETENDEFWQPILDNPKFDEFIRGKYQLC